MNIGNVISEKRKALGLTQQALAEKLHVSFQAISKWENGTSCPDIELLPQIAAILKTTIDSLLGYPSQSVTDYDKRYGNEEYYWGLKPNNLCYEIMRIKPPVKPYKVIDIGCGRRQGTQYFLQETAMMLQRLMTFEQGMSKARELADTYGVKVDFFKADVRDFRLEANYDIIFSSGVFHYIPLELRENVVNNLKAHTINQWYQCCKCFCREAIWSSSARYRKRRICCG